MTADGTGLEFLADGCADGVIAEDRTLSRHLAAEELVAEIARVLRPGGQVLACVDSLTYGMGVLAEQHRWPHLVDVPNADVVLIPWPDGTITRCYGAEQLRELFTGARPARSAGSGRAPCSRRRRSATCLPATRRASPTWSTRSCAPVRDDSVGTQLIACCEKPAERGGASLRDGGSAQRRRSRFAWHGTQRAVAGRTSRRGSGTGLPQSTHRP